MMYLGFISNIKANVWLGLKGVLTGIQNLSWNLWEGIVNITRGVSNTFQDLGMVLSYVNKAFSLAGQCINLLPSSIKAFAVITVAVLVAFQIAGRTGGAK